MELPYDTRCGKRFEELVGPCVGCFLRSCLLFRSPHAATPSIGNVTNSLHGTSTDLNVFYTESNLGRRESYSLDQVLIGGIQPNMILGMLLGAEFLPTLDADADIAAHCLEGRGIESLPPIASLLTHPLIEMWERQIRELPRPGGDTRQPIPPFFWDASGRAAVHGPVTTGLKFWGDEFLLNLVADPSFCAGAVDWLTDAVAELVQHFATVVGRTVDCIHVGECVACMLDVDSFRRYIVPAASRLGDRFGSLRLHSCGRSDHLIEACRAIRGLSSLDVGGETSVARIRAVSAGFSRGDRAIGRAHA